MTPEAQKKPISFHEWQQALAASGESPSRQRVFEGEIMGFLRRCKQLHSPASVELAKQYLDARPTQDGNDARDALRWFVRAARSAEGGIGGRSDGRTVGGGRSDSQTVSDPLAHARGHPAQTGGGVAHGIDLKVAG